MLRLLAPWTQIFPPMKFARRTKRKTNKANTTKQLQTELYHTLVLFTTFYKAFFTSAIKPKHHVYHDSSNHQGCICYELYA